MQVQIQKIQKEGIETGLKVMTNGVRADWLFCGRGFKASWREMLRKRFTSLLEGGDCPCNARKFISS